jgi:hypothetical protein
MSFAIFRKSPEHDDLAKLAEDHFEHDLEPSDREVLKKAAGKVSLPTTIGTLVGLGLGLYAAFKLRKVRLDVFNAFRASEKPTHVIFSGGRTGESSSLFCGRPIHHNNCGSEGPGSCRVYC